MLSSFKDRDTARLNMGLPPKWRTVRLWLTSRSFPPLNEKKEKSKPTTSGRFRQLKDYSKDPGRSFWSSFPSAELPVRPTSKVSPDALKVMINTYTDRWPKSKVRRAWQLYEDLSVGGQAYQSCQLSPAILPNARSAYQNGAMLTEKIAEFIEKGFVKGPFFGIPCENFRSNTLMAVERNDKIRPVINMSGPDGASYNSNIDKLKLEKVRMSSAKAFSYQVRAAGKGALMSKFDLQDAFKLIPAKTCDLRLQGFSWLGAFFVESQMIFGAIPSVSNFDRLASTVVELTKTLTGLRHMTICRTLDDIPIVSDKESGWTASFSQSLEEVCSKLGVPLAEECPRKEKAFKNSTRGVVLGIGFNSEDLTWFIPEEKARKIHSSLLSAYSSPLMDLKCTQVLMGRLVDFTQMCPFARIFTCSGYRFLASFNSNENILKSPPEDTRLDWSVCARILETAKLGLPLHKMASGPALGAVTFFSDAAGCKFDMKNGERVCCNEKGKRGVACLSMSDGSVDWSCTLIWPVFFLEEARDEKGRFFGSKTTTLEAIGILIPFIVIPERLSARHVLFYTDNIAVVYGWQSKGVKNDSSATLIIRSIALMAAFLGSTVHIIHVPRMSNKGASLADSLSRSGPESAFLHGTTIKPDSPAASGFLWSWLANPTPDYNLPFNLLLELESKINSTFSP